MSASAAREILTGVTNVTDIIGSSPMRFYPQVAPEGVTVPFCTYRTVNIDPTKCKGSTSRIDVIDFDIRIFAKDVLVLEDLKVKIRAALDLYRGTVSVTGGQTTVIDKINFVTESDDFSENNENELHEVVVRYAMRVKRFIT